MSSQNHRARNGRSTASSAATIKHSCNAGFRSIARFVPTATPSKWWRSAIWPIPAARAFTEAQVKALAATYQIKDGPNDAGDMFERPGRPSDYFPWNFANSQAAVAALGALPPDMSLLAKARTYERGFPLFLIDPIIQYQEQGPDYIYALLNGYTNDKDPNWNEYMPGHKIAMPKPLSDGAVDYADGSPKTVPQYAKDVTAFLMWAAEPKLEERKRVGFGVLIFLVVYALLLLVVKKKIWHSPAAHPSHDTP